MDKIKIWRLLLILFMSIALSLQRSTSSSYSSSLEMWRDLEESPSAASSSSSAAIMTALTHPSYSLWKERLQQHRKRGFSMLARWKPFNTLGNQRTSIRNINHALFPINDYGELVSAETRAFSRPSGQPLRWG